MGGKICVADKATPGTLFRVSFVFDMHDVRSSGGADKTKMEEKNESWRLDAPLLRALWDGSVLLVMDKCIVREVCDGSVLRVMDKCIVREVRNGSVILVRCIVGGGCLLRKEMNYKRS